MDANLLAAGCVRWIGRERLDCAAIGSESEVMNRLLVRKAHHLIAALDYSLLVRIGRLLSLNTKAQHNEKRYATNILHAALDVLIQVA
jgi:hypothetical protein